MTLSDFRHITDELLSAYIDDEVTEQDRALIDAAIAQDEEIAWRLNSLRQTVSLLQELPELALPRSFVLTLEQLQIATPSESVAHLNSPEAQLATPKLHPASKPQKQAEAGFWERLREDWGNFWQGGNHLLRNAAAVSFALMLVISGAGQVLTRSMMQPAGMMATSSAPAASDASAGSMAATAQPAAEIAMAPAPAESAEDSIATKSAGEETGSEEVANTAMARMAPEANAEEESAADVAAAQAGEAAVAEAASDSPTSESSMAMQAAPAAAYAPEATEPAVAAAMMAPAPANAIEESAESTVASSPESSEQAAVASSEPTPPLVAQPFPGGLGRGQGGGGEEGVGGEGGAGGDTSLVPPDSFAFDVNPVGEEPQEEVVVAAAAAAPESATEGSAAVADVEVTPAVDAVAASTEVQSTEAEITEAESADIESAEQNSVAEATEEVATSESSQPTPEAVALAAPQNITTSQVVENVGTEGAVSPQSPASNLPVLWIAQGTTLLLTVLLASLWWRSRNPRRSSR